MRARMNRNPTSLAAAEINIINDQGEKNNTRQHPRSSSFQSVPSHGRRILRKLLSWSNLDL